MEQTALEKPVSSLCPICLKVVSARIFSKDSMVFIEKKCDEHGDFQELYWSDLSLYKKFNRYWCNGHESDKISLSGKGCPFDCGLCENHLTGTLLGNIDLTNRCNLKCPVCFADAGGRIYEPNLDLIRSMMQNLRSQKPVGCPAIQFSGGEPTMREDLPQIIAMAKEMGFSQIQVATNGLRLASSLDLCRSLERAG